MEKSVNGKSFDEIFAQRGKEVKVEEMERGKVYITDETFTYWPCIFKLAEEWFGFADKPFWAYYAVTQNGYYDTETQIYGEAFYEATPDQIDLLNAYKNE